MKQSKTPLWKKSILQKLNLSDIRDYLYEISDNGDIYGYDGGDDGYYQDYKDLFDDLAASAYRLWETLEESNIEDNWDDMTVALLGETQKVLGYDTLENDYYHLVNGYQEEFAVEEAEKRVMRLTKQGMIRCFRKVLGTLVAFYDIKTAHDCLTSIVQELDEKGAILERKNDAINQIYEDYTDTDHKELDDIVNSISPNSRMWVE